MKFVAGAYGFGAALAPPEGACVGAAVGTENVGFAGAVGAACGVGDGVFLTP